MLALVGFYAIKLRPKSIFPSLSHSLRPFVRPFLEEAIGDGDGVADAAVNVLGGVTPLPHAAGAVAALAGVDHGLLLLHPAADVADEAVDAAEEHRAEDEHGRHQDLGDGRGTARLVGQASHFWEHSPSMSFQFRLYCDIV